MGSVVALDIVAKDEAMVRFAQERSVSIYAVEYVDGSDAEIPEAFLERS